MIADGVGALRSEQDIATRDIAELVAAAMGCEPGGTR
jgi:hypothetical protein